MLQNISIMPALCLMLRMSYYVETYPGIIRQTLLTVYTVKQLQRPPLYSGLLSITASSLCNGHFFVPSEGPYIHSYFKISITAKSPQRQRPLKHIPTTKITSRKRPLNQLLTNGVYETPFFYCKKAGNLILTARRYSLFLFCFCFLGISNEH